MTVTSRTAPASFKPALRFATPGAIETGVFALSLLTGPLLSRKLGVEGRGSLASVVVPLQLLSWTLLAGIPYSSAMLSRTERRRTLLNGAWAVVACLTIPVVVAVFVLAPGMLDGRPDSTIHWLRLGLIGVVLGMPAAVALQIRLVRTGPTLAFSAAKSLHMISYSIGVLGLAAAGQLTLSTALASWVGAFLAAPLIVVVWLRAFPTGTTSPAQLRAQILGGRANAMAGWATASLGRLDQVFLAMLGTPADLGHYAVAATAAQASLPFCKGLADFVFPRMFQGGGNLDARRLVLLAFGISTAIGVISAVAAPFGIPLIFGADFTDSVPLLFLLLPGQVLFNTAWVMSAEQYGKGRPGIVARGLVTAAILNLVLVVPLIKLAGPQGAAVLTTACQAIYFVIVLRLSNSSRSTMMAEQRHVGAQS